MNPRISVVICTYNRSDYLKKALLSLMRQTLDASAYEIIVVDNNSTDNTTDAVNKIKKDYKHISVHLIREEQQGLSPARNTGYKRAKGEYIAYLDDDAQAPDDWLLIGIGILDSLESKPDAIGGPEKAILLGEKPPWYKDSYGVVSTDVMGKNARYLTKKESLTGSNMIIRRDLLEKHGGFPTQLGMRGEDLAAHEETEFFHTLRNADNGEARVYYDPDLVILHTVPTEKQTVKYLMKRAYAGGQSWYLRSRSNSLVGKVTAIVKGGGYVIGHSLLALPCSFSYRYYQQWIVERGKYIAFGLGYLTKAIGIDIKVKQSF